MRLTIVLLRSLISQRWARTLVGSPGWAPGHSVYRLKRADSARQKMWAGLSSSSLASSQVDLHTEDKKCYSWKILKAFTCLFLFSFFSRTLNTHSPPLSVAFCHTHTPPLSSFLSLSVTHTFAFSLCHTPTPPHTHAHSDSSHKRQRILFSAISFQRSKLFCCLSQLLFIVKNTVFIFLKFKK